MHRYMRTVLVIGLMTVLTPSLFAETFSLQSVTIYPDSRDAQSEIRTLISDSVFALSQYPGNEDASFTSGRMLGDFQLTITAVSSGGSDVFTAQIFRSSDNLISDSYTLLADWKSLTPSGLAAIFSYLIDSLDGFEPEDNTPPLLLDRFSLDIFRFRDISVSPTLMPYSAAPGPEGGWVIGASALALSFDEDFVLNGIIGKDLLESGKYSEFFDIEVTPSGILYSRPISGPYVYQFLPGTGQPRRIPTTIQQPLAFTVLNDGSPVLSDSGSVRVVKVVNNRARPLPVTTNEYISPYVMTAGSSGSLWILDQTDGILRGFAPDGTFIESIIPHLRADERNAVKTIDALPDGSFLIVSPTTLYRIDSFGKIIWSTKGIPGDPNFSFNMAFDAIFNGDNGEILLPMSSTGEIVRLWDREYSLSLGESAGGSSFQNREVLAAAQIQRIQHGDTAETLSPIAEIHQEHGADHIAAAYWNQVLLYEPYDSNASDALAAFELADLKQQTAILHQSTLSILGSRGPESARQSYQKTIALYEEILYLEPGNREIARLKEQLESAYARASGNGGPGSVPLTLEEIAMPPYFPALSPYYASNGWAKLKLTNPHDEGISQINTEIFIPGYMEFAQNVVFREDNAQTLDSGASGELDLRPILSSQVLELQEDVPVQIRIEISYTLNSGAQNRFTRTFSSTLQRSSALVWDDSAKLASFISGNTASIRDFALGILGNTEYRPDADDSAFIHSTGGKIERAVVLISALAALGFNYVEDPLSPFTSVSGSQSTVDTVRFPPATLLYRAGDCDDTTAMLSSILESSGIPTAIVTSPGHVFLAFDSGEPVENRWLYESDKTVVIAHNGTLWIPVETTILSQGFSAAWESASELVRLHLETPDMEVIPVAQAHAQYPPVPVPAGGSDLLFPSPAAVLRQLSSSDAQLAELLYESKVSDAQNMASAFSGRRADRLLLRSAALHSRYGRGELAEEILLQIIEGGNTSPAVYVTLSNVYLLEGRVAEAIAIAGRGIELNPASAELLITRALAFQASDESGKARSDFMAAGEINPQLTQNYLPNDGASRASNSGESAALIWPDPEL